MSYNYSYPPAPAFSAPGHSSSQPQQPPVYQSTPPPIYSPDPSLYAPHSQTTYATPQYSQYQQQQQQQQDQQFQQQHFQQQHQNYMDYSHNAPADYEFDFQQPSSQNASHQQLFLGQMAANISSGTLAATALQYGPTLAATGKDFLDQKLDSFTEQSRGVYKRYWAVDTNYVLRKLFYLLFPFSSGSNSNGFYSSPTSSDCETRTMDTPDLYIPSMSFVTYILMVGYVLGTQGRFSPDLLGITATSALVWLTLEISVSLVATYLTGMYTSGLWHRLCVLSGYKFFYMVCCISVFGVLGPSGYYISILATALSNVLFTIHSLRSALSDQIQSYNRTYLSFAIALAQPVMVYWLSWHLVHYS